MLIDLLIITIIVISVLHNYQSGFTRQIFSGIGFILGLLIGRAVETYTITLVHDPLNRALMTLTTIFGFALLGLVIGEFIGIKIKIRWLETRLNKVDNLLGSILTVLIVLFSTWLVSSVVVRLPSTQLKKDIAGSKIISSLNSLLPPAPTVITNLGHLISPNGFPDVFIGNEPIPKGNVNLPSLGDFNSAVNADRLSVVRVQGIGCGGIVSGSGFVAANNLVITNAHVVAGISNPYIEDANGRHTSTVVSFDPNLDIAVLKTNNLAGKPLNIDDKDQNSGTPGAVLGYPGGGSFQAVSAAVINEIDAIGRNIYGTTPTSRSVYELNADVIPGNSGGPLIESNGQVMGVIFATSTTYNHVGYALAMHKVDSELHQAEVNPQPVSSGQCAD